jgi:hypothetical protein
MMSTQDISGMRRVMLIFSSHISTYTYIHIYIQYIHIYTYLADDEPTRQFRNEKSYVDVLITLLKHV